mmetsp:Transcript_32334/g.106746  ORF Transcript_32334/g.106746 Transcript_32334/m.106746 type:complete len:382 (-) Transcript_32334:261-1406(-)
MLPAGDGGLGEDEESLLRRIECGADLAGVQWAASELLCRLHRVPSSVPQHAAEVLMDRLQSIAGPGAIEGAPTWSPPTTGRPLHANRVLGGGPALAAAFQPLPGAELEAASSLLAALLDLLHARREDQVRLREHLMETGSHSPGCFWLFLRVFASGDLDHGGAAFVRCCHLLALLAEGDEHMSRALRSARALDLVADRLARATKGDALGTEWLPFATAAAHLLQILICEEDTQCMSIADPTLFVPAWAHSRKPDTTVDALIEALRRSLVHVGGHMVAQALHTSALRALGTVAHLSRSQAQRMLAVKGADLAVAVLRHDGSDEEAVSIALWYIAELAPGSPFSPKAIAASGAEAAARSAMSKYPWSQRVQVEAERVIRACQG